MSATKCAFEIGITLLTHQSSGRSRLALLLNARVTLCIAALQSRGVQQDCVTTRPVDMGGYVIDSTVAARDVKEGETLLRVPDHLVVTLNRSVQLRMSTFPSASMPPIAAEPAAGLGIL